MFWVKTLSNTVVALQYLEIALFSGFCSLVKLNCFLVLYYLKIALSKDF